MTPEDLLHWVEVLGAALIGLGGWLWTVGSKYQGLKGAIKHLFEKAEASSNAVDRLENKMEREVEELERRIAAVDHVRGESASRIYARLEEIGRTQAAQGAQISNIAEICNRTNQGLMDILAGRRAGGNRWNDPHAPGGNP